MLNVEIDIHNILWQTGENHAPRMSVWGRREASRIIRMGRCYPSKREKEDVFPAK
jgi:hypothetical protein